MASAPLARLPLRAGLALLFVSALTIPACSDDDSGSSTGTNTPGGTPIKLENFGAAFAPILCDAVKQCQGPAFDLAFGDAAVCTSLLTNEFTEGTYPTLKAAIDKGNATYNENAAGACIDKLKSLGCGFQTQRLGDLCKDALVGKLAGGADCSESAECVQGHFCKVDAACPGKCAQLLAEGSACKDDDECQSGLICDEGGSKTCVKPGGSGAPCDQGKPPCSLDLLCAGADDKAKTPGTCKASSDVLALAPGTACDLAKTQLCAPGISCQVDKLEATGATFVCAAKVASGAACKIAVPSICPAGEYCEGIDTSKGKIDGTCKPELTEGQACAQNTVGNGCKPGLRCIAGKCQAPGKNGAACTTNADCYGDCVKGVCAPETACQ